MPLPKGYGPKKSQGSICPFWTRHPKSIGCTNPLTLLSRQPYSPWDTNAAPRPHAMEVPCQYQDCICCSFNKADGVLLPAKWQKAGLWRSRAESSTPQSPVALGHGLFWAVDSQLHEVLCKKLGCLQARCACIVLYTEPLILLILLTQRLQLLHTFLRRQWLLLARMTRQKLT